MKQAILGALGAAVLMGGAYVLGRLDAADPQPLLAQGKRGPVIPPKPRSNKPATAPKPLVYGGDSSMAASANGFIAVTGSYGVGTSVLYVLDTNTKQLAVYAARGGSPNTAPTSSSATCGTARSWPASSAAWRFDAT